MDFIDKNRAHRSTAKMANSRKRMLEKLAPINPIVPEHKSVFEFPAAAPISRTDSDISLLQLKDVSFRHSKESPVLLSNLRISIGPKTRLGILGANGVGKSTLVGLMYGKLKATSGSVKRSKKTILGYFAQHHIDQLNLTATPFQALFKKEIQQLEELDRLSEGRSVSHPSRSALLDEDDREKKVESFVRCHLASFGLPKFKQDQSMHTLSGGEKSRVAFALSTLQPPNLLIMDEPTNHLDLDTISSFETALASWEGALVVVSHDQQFLKKVASEFLVLRSGCTPRIFDDFATASRYAYTGPAIAFQPEKQKKSKKGSRDNDDMRRGEQISMNNCSSLSEKWYPGKKIRIAHLTGEKSQHLNGKTGIVKSFDKKLNRFLISLSSSPENHQNPKVVALKAMNLLDSS
eukprot:CAMPEP_0114530006 /NCGR_PEP_ID=MMETSP0109-20121206/25178_1 /TAXON_ID=29199 /ORGANISM="Chlorarachnion reptans, Strain CCCM449" /LENGTH=405 /DNA_ID=CAMNT_0001712527 /DNA_START=445 /DNA_END=1662 /DNA_ORIENTATION=+